MSDDGSDNIPTPRSSQDNGSNIEQDYDLDNSQQIAEKYLQENNFDEALSKYREIKQKANNKYQFESYLKNAVFKICDCLLNIMEEKENELE